MRSPTPFLDYSTRDYLGYRELMLNQIPIKMPEYTDRSESDAGISIIELLSYGLDVTSLNIDIIANEAFLYTAREMENVDKWVRGFGYNRKSSTVAVFDQVFEVMQSRNDIIIPAGTRLRTTTNAVELPVVFETVQNLLIPAGARGTEQDANGNYIYAVDVSEGITIHGDIVGTSNAVQNQTFRLSYTPVVKDTVQVFVDEGAGPQEWRRVDSFLESTANSKDFVVFIETNGVGVINFGNGTSGKIPGVHINGISATYKTGGGEVGNVGPNKITEIISPIAGVIGTYNPGFPKIEGRDIQTVQEVKDDFIRLMRTNDRAVTKFDFHDVMMRYPYMKMYDAHVVLDVIDKTVLVYVLYENMPPDNSFPYWPDMQMDFDQMLDPYKSLNKYLDDRRLVNVYSYVMPAKRFPINVVAEVAYDPYRNIPEMQSAVYLIITAFFRTGSHLIGQPFILSRLISAIQNIDGVESVRMLNQTDQEVPEDSYAVLGTSEVIWWNKWGVITNVGT